MTLPFLVSARSSGGEVVRTPEAVQVQNSQTMDLLEGFLNTNPTGTGGAEIAIVDNTALSSEGDDTSLFIDGAKSGGQINVYVVRKGDTLSGIAKMFDVSTNTIVWANDIKGGKIAEGQELVILPITGVRYTVRSGDTLNSIAVKYKADLDEVLAYNNLTPNSKIKVGDVVIVPGGEVGSDQRPASQNVKQSTSVASGYYLRPIAGGRKSQGIHGYNGVDIAAPVGTPVRASADGKVIIARSSGYNGGYGLYVAISHANGTQTLYAHMSRVNVSVGQYVEKGQAIGAVGNTGRSTGAHIHFEVRGARNPF